MNPPKLWDPDPITDPVIVCRSGRTFLVIDRKVAAGPRPPDQFAPAILWNGKAWSDLRPIGVWFKFLYYLEDYDSTPEQEGLPPLPAHQAIMPILMG